MPIGRTPGKDDIGKIFVGGLNISTDSAGLQAYFEQYGEVTDCVLMTDPVTKKSRCFGFVTFRDPSAVEKAVNDRPHILDNKTIDPKPAVPRGPGQAPPQQHFPRGMGRGGMQAGRQGKGDQNNEFKIFIGGVAHTSDKEDLAEYFSAYGKVVHVNLMMDQETKKMRGFGFVTFDSKESVGKAVAEHYHTINGKTVEAKRVQNQEQKQRPSGPGGSNSLVSHMHPMAANSLPGFPGPYGSFGPGALPGMGRGYGGLAGPAGGYGLAAAGLGAGNPYGGYGYGANAAGLPSASYGPAAGLAGYGSIGREAAAAGYAAGFGYGNPAEFSTAGGLPGASPIPGSTAAARAELAGAAELSSTYSMYGLGSYQQTDSQYGPTRGSFPADPGYGGYPGAEAYGAGAGGAVAFAGESFGRGGGAATRGFHPYGR